MNDDFDKQNNDDDDFDWLSDDGDEESSDSSGLTGELSWLQDADESPDAKKGGQTDDLDLEWMDQGEQSGSSQESTGVTGELSWLQDADESPDAKASDDVPDWLQADDGQQDIVAEDDVPDTQSEPRGLLADFEDDGQDGLGETSILADSSAEQSPEWLSDAGETGSLNEPDETPEWLSDMGETGSLNEPDETPEWLSNVGDTRMLDRDEINRQLDAWDNEDQDETLDLEDESPDWLSGMGIGETSDIVTEYSDEADSTEDTPDWLQGIGDDSPADTPPDADELDIETMFGVDDTTGNTGKLVEPQLPATEGDTGWLEYEDDETDETEYDPYAQYAEDVDDEEEFEDVFAPGTEITTDELASKTGLFDIEQPVSEPVQDDESLDWLEAYSDDDFGEENVETPIPDAIPTGDTDWLSNVGDAFDESQPVGDAVDDPLNDVPDWLKGGDDTLEDVPQETEDEILPDFDLDVEPEATGVTGELADVGDTLDLDFLDELDDELSRGSTGLTGELSQLDDSDFDLLDDIDFDDLELDDVATGLTGELSQLDDDDFDIDLFDDLGMDSEEPIDTGLTGELSQLDDDFDIDLFDDFSQDSEEPIDTGLTGELVEDDQDLDLSFLNEDEVGGATGELAPTGLTDDLAEVDEELDLSFLDEVEVSDSAPDRVTAGLTDDIAQADEELDLSFLDEVDEEEGTDWFDEAEEGEIDAQPEWMDTLNKVDTDDLVAEANQTEFEDLFGVEPSFLDDNDESVANLDSFLATIEDADEADYDAADSASQMTDLDAIFDAAFDDDISGPDDDLPENIPDWLRDVEITGDEASAASIVRQQRDKPLESLDDRLKALREKGISVTAQADKLSSDSAPRVLSGVEDTLAIPSIKHETMGITSTIALSDDQKQQANLLQEIVGVTITPNVETDEEGAPIVESSRRRRRALPNIGLARLLIASILFLALIAPFVTDLGVGAPQPLAFGATDNNANAVFNQIQAINEGDWVLVGFEYGPTAAGELDSVADILLRHIFSRGGKPIIVSSNPVAVVHAQNILNDINQSVRASGLNIAPNRDYYIVRYLTGGTLGLRDLTQNLNSVVSVSAVGDPTNLDLQSLDDFALMLVIAERSDDIRAWAEQIVPSTTTRLVAGTGYAAQPLAEPYVNQTDGISGLVVGFRDAYTYGEMLQGFFATATPTPTPTMTSTFTATAIPTVTNTPEPTETPLATATDDSGDGQAVDTGADGTSSPATEVIATDTPVPTDTAVPTTVPTNTVVPTATATATATVTPRPTNTPRPTATPNLIKVLVVTATDGSVNVRSGPSTQFTTIDIANPGDVFLVIDENEDGSWVNFEFPDGREGWIAGFLVEITELPEADLPTEESDDSADAGQGVSVMRVEYRRRMGKNQARYYQQVPTATPDDTEAVLPTPDPRASFAYSRDTQQDNSRLDAMTVGTITAVVIILFGNIFYGLQAIRQRRRESKK